MTTCVTCHLTAIRHEQPLCECIYETKGWRVAHAFNTSLPGWLVVIAKRHVASFAELTEAEVAEVGPFLYWVSRALQTITVAAKTYTVLFAEHLEHPHVHFHVVPSARTCPKRTGAPAFLTILGVPETKPYRWQSETLSPNNSATF